MKMTAYSNHALKPFHLLLILAGGLMFMTSFVPIANAAELTYFNFEDSSLGNPPDFTSDGALSSTITTNYSITFMKSVAGIPLNGAAGDADPNLLALGLSAVGGPPGTPAGTFLGDFNIPLFTPLGIQSMSLSFAYNSQSNGFNAAKLFYSTDGGLTFPFMGTTDPLLTNGTNQVATFSVPMGANDEPLLVLRIELSGGTSTSPAAFLTTLDNIQVTGTIVGAGVPDTGTTASLFGFSLVGMAFLRRKLC